MKRTVKLADVARAAGVSQGTASNVFAKPELVRPEVRERVEEVAKALGYHGPDPKGRLLRAGKVNAIGVVVMDDLAYFFNDPFNREFMTGVAEVCDARGAGISLVSAVNRESVAWGIDTALVDGFILQCIEDGDRLIELARKRGLPFVAVDVDAGPDASSLMVDDRLGARLAAEHLLALGHRQFGILCLEIHSDGRKGIVDKARRAEVSYGATRDRLAGYRDALEAAGISFKDTVIVESDSDKKGALVGARTLLDAAPGITAVLAMSDVMALALMAVAEERGLAIPDDISVIGYDDVPEAATAEPPLTTISQHVTERGRAAARIIFDPAPPRKETMPVDLVIRASTGPARPPR
jgi:DNA-binding LacI/PurR family transcriptional regulator